MGVARRFALVYGRSKPFGVVREVHIRGHELAPLFEAIKAARSSLRARAAVAHRVDGQRLLVMLNFKAKDAAVKTDLDLSRAQVLVRNYAQPSRNGRLRPYAAVIFEL